VLLRTPCEAAIVTSVLLLCDAESMGRIRY
jgi:hypothetical protein